ncbi:MAG: MurR/RpiR family transcriptional regulator [Negativicutes bacterium]|nr:MurR/RpiR family transcriptional regulator [Negativicutes bacterium]
MDNLFSHIRTRYHILSPTQKRIADFVLCNSEGVFLLSLSELAEKCQTSETTILRFLHKLGIDSYQVFRVRIAQDAASRSGQAIYEEIRVGEPLDQIRQKVIMSTVTSIQDLNNLITTAVLEKVAGLILKAKRILFCGVGASGVVATDAFHKFLRLGIDAAFFTDTHFMNIACSHVDSNTLVFAITHSGESRDILEATALAKKNRAKVVALTSHAHSTITQQADYILLSSSNETKFRSDAMVSRILQLVILDILYVAVVLKLGETGVDKINTSRLAVAKKKR